MLKKTALWTVLLILISLPLFAAGTLVPLQPIVQNGIPLIGLLYPMWIDAESLSAGVAATHAIPTGANYALFSATGNFYVAYSGVAAVPGSAITNGTGPELNPVLRSIAGLTSISIIAPAGCVVTISFWK